MTPLALIEPAGTAAREISWLYWFMIALSVVTLVVVVVALFVGARRGQLPDGDGPPPLEPPPDSEASNRWLGWGGVVMPSVAIVAILVSTLVVMSNTDPRRVKTEITIEVTGHQWWWEVGYPDDEVVTANEVHIPAGEPVLLRLQSDDVIHSFWVPELSGKMDLLPDRPNRLVIDADEPGRYEGRCAEFCGLQHTMMSLAVIAHDRADYEAWLAANTPRSGEVEAGAATSSSETAAGAEIFRANCGSCHQVAGVTDEIPREMPAPNLATLSGRASIGAGAAPNTRENRVAWVTNPNDVKEGALMPQPELSDEEIQLVVDYIDSLTP